MAAAKKTLSHNGVAMLPARKAAKRMVVAPDYVGKLCREGKLECLREGNSWFIAESSIIAFEKTRETARKERAEALAQERRTEQEAYRNAVGLPLKKPHAPAQSTLGEVLKSVMARRLAVALAGLVLFVAAGFSGASVLSSPRLLSEEARSSLSAALSQVPSPFFSTRLVVLSFDTERQSGVASLFERILAFLFGPHSAPLAGEGAPASEPVTPAPVSAPSAPTAVAPVFISPAVERIVQQVISGDWIPADAMVMILSELHRSLRADISRIVAGSLDNRSTGGSGGLSLSDLTDANIPDSITAENYLPLAGGTLTGALDNTSVATSTWTGPLSLERLNTLSTSTLAGVQLTNLDCTGFNNSGKLTADADGNVVCAHDVASAGGGAPGGGVGDVQYNDGLGDFGAEGAFDYDATANRLTVPFASTTGITSSYASSTNLFAGTFTLGGSAFTSLLGTGLANSLGLLTVDDTVFLSLAEYFASTSPGHIVALPNLLVTSSQISDFNTEVNEFIHGSSTIPKTYTANTFSAAQIFDSITRSTTTNATTTSFAVTSLPNALLSTNAQGSVVATTSIGTNYLTGSLGTINGTTFNAGSSITITAASSTLLSNNNTFSGINAFTGNVTLANATATSFFATIASSTNLFALNLGVTNFSVTGASTSTIVSGLIIQGGGLRVSTLTSCDSVDTDLSGNFICGTDNASSGSSFAFPFDAASYDGQAVFATSTGIWLTGSPLSLIASSTFATNATTTNATTTNLAVSSVISSLLKTNGIGSVVAAVAGVDYANFGYPFPNNATTTTLTFSQGLLSVASTTIGSGAQAGGLTVSGGATTTGSLYVGGSASVGSTSPFARLSVHAQNGGTHTTLFAIGSSTANSTTTLFAVSNTGSTTVANGVNITDGCFAIDGVCIAASTGLTSIGPAGQLQTGPGITLSTSSVAFNGLTPGLVITGNANIIDFQSTLSGSLQDGGVDNNLTIDGGTINNTPIGALTPATAIFTNATATNATTTNLAVTSTASTSALIVSGNANTNSLTIAGLGGGGSQCLEVDASGVVSATGVGCGTGSGESQWAFFNNSGVRLATSTNQVLVGAGATSSLAQLEVIASTTVPNSIAGYFSGRVGVGTSSPAALFGIHARNGELNRTLFSVASSTANSTTTLFAVSNTGNVGIGSSTPWGKLSVVGGNIVQTASGNPTLASSTATAGNVNAVYVAGRYVYTAEGSAGLRIRDISNPRAPTTTGAFTAISGAQAVVVSGGYAYVGDTATGFNIVDVSNPSSPSLAGRVSFTNAYDVALSGRYAFVTALGTLPTGDGSLRVIDVADPTRPRLVGTYLTGGNPYAVAVSGKYAYVGDYTNGDIEILDISNPSAPSLVGTYSATTITPTDLYVSGKYLYVADEDNGFYIVNVANPASPAFVGSYDDGGSHYGVVAAGDYAYIANFLAETLDVVNVSNPASPTLVGSYTSGDSPFGLYVAGKYAYLASGAGGLHIVDINGADLPAAQIGSLAAQIGNFSDSLNVGQDIYAGGGLVVGLSGIFSRGALGVHVASTTAGNPTAASFMGGNVGIGSSTPTARLTILANSNETFTNTLFLIASSTANSTTTLFAVSNTGSTTIAGQLNSVFANMLSSTTLLGSTLLNQATTTSLAITGTTNALLSTNSLGSVVATSTLGVNVGGTGANTFGQGWIYSQGGTGALAASTSPTVNYLTATSTTATSTFAWAVRATCFTTDGTTCITGSGGSSLFTDSGTATYLTDTDDNLGLGTTTPNWTLQVASATPYIAITDTDAGEDLKHWLISNISGTFRIGTAADDLTSTTTRLKIDDTTNFAVGVNALSSNQTGTDNIALGDEALAANTEGSNNIVLGSQSLSSNTLGGSNIALGPSVLGSNTTGSRNIALGETALSSLDGGDENIALGTQALSGLSSGSSNIVIGPYAGGNQNSGDQNILIGYSVDLPNLDGSNQLNFGNIIFGTNIDGTGDTLSTGSIGIGTTTPLSKLTVYGDLFLEGTDRYINFATTTGSGGYGLRDNAGTVEFKNMGGDWSALISYLTVDGNFNIFTETIGALAVNTTGARNLALGSNALAANTEGNDNIALGDSALSANTTGADNIALGKNVLSSLTSGDGNTVIGEESLADLTNGSYNTVIGSSAGGGLEGSNNIIIGANKQFPTPSGSDRLNIGNLIYGVSVDGVGATLSTGNIGIGTSTPFATLQVATTSGKNLVLTDTDAGTNLKHWLLSSIGGTFRISTSSDTLATTSLATLSISASGFGTTTLTGLEISGFATSTSNVGFNITDGCYAVDNTCLSTSGSSNWTDQGAYLTPLNTGDGILVAGSSTIGGGTQATGLTVFGGATTTGNLAVQGTGTSTIAGKLAVGTTTPPANALFTIATSTLMFMIDQIYGNTGIGTTSRETSRLTVSGHGGNDGLEYVSTYTSTTSALSAAFASGNHVYAPNNAGAIEIFSIVDPELPSFVSVYATSTSLAFPFVNGTHLYVESGEFSDIEIVNVSTPASPTFAGAYGTSTGSVSRPFVAGSHMYVESGMFNDIEIINISTPTNPTFTTAIGTSTSVLSSPFVSGNLLFVADNSENVVLIYDVTTPATPLFQGAFGPNGINVGFYVSGNYLYVLNDENEIDIADISTPTAPIHIATIAVADGAGTPIVSGNYLYFLDSNNKVAVFDVSNPAAPRFIDRYTSPAGGINNSLRHGNILAGYLFGGDSNQNIEIIDISQPAPSYAALFQDGRVGVNTDNPLAKFNVVGEGNDEIELFGSYDTAGTAYDVLVVGDYAYVPDGGGEDGLVILDVSDRANPTLAALYATSTSRDIVIDEANDIGYLAAGNHGVVALDISDPNNPTYISQFDTADFAQGLFLVGTTTLYVADKDNFYVLDTSDPSSMQSLGTFDPTGDAYHVFVDENAGIAYLATGGSGDGLKVLDVSNPGSIAQIGSYPTAGSINTRDVVVDTGNNVAYLAAGTNGLLVLNVSDPSDPTLLDSYNTPDFSWGIFRVGDIVYVADGGSGLLVFDVSDTSNVDLIDSYDTPDSARGVFVEGTTAYVADSSGGLIILNISSVVEPSSLSALFTGGNVGIGTNDPLAKLDVAGGLILSGSGRYFNFNSTAGGAGYGLRDNNGVIQVKNSGENWQNISIVDSNYNTFAGSNTFTNGGATGGSNNIAFGQAALVSDSSGDNNVALGASALGVLTSGNHNIAIGSEALADLTTGGSNIALGQGALAVLTGSNSNGNIAIGINAGNTLTGGEENIAIGRGAWFPDTDDDYQLSIGNLIFGTDLDSTTDQQISSGNIGIGTTTPWGRLSVQKDSGVVFLVTANDADLPTFIVTGDGGGRAGVGTTTPYARLSVTGGLDDSVPALVVSNNSNTPHLTVSNTGFGTTTLTGLTINGSATSTSNVGFNITDGCYAVDDVCLSTSGSSDGVGSWFVADTNFGAVANSTTTPIWFKNGLQASSTAQLTDANIWGKLNFATTSTSTLATLGNQSLLSASATNFSTSLGISAGVNLNANGVRNSALGYQALQNATSTADNVAVGYQALIGAVTTFTGVKNVAVGSQALFGNSTGGSNVALGYQALSLNTTGSSSVAVGDSALRSNTTGSHNTALGFQAGYSVSDGYANILLGSHISTADVITTGDGNIGLGNELWFPSATANNQLNLGNFVFGTLPATSTSFFLPTTGALGVATSSPFATLSVHANNGSTNTTLFAIGSSTASATTTLFAVSNTGSTTAANGFNISAGCFAQGGTCLPTLSQALFYSDWQVVNNDYLAPTTTRGIIVNASSTIGAGGQATGLTVFGGATTTGNAVFLNDLSVSNNLSVLDGLNVSGTGYFSSKLGVGSSSPFANFSIHANENNELTTLFAIGSSTASATTTLFAINNAGSLAVNLDPSATTLLVLDGSKFITSPSLGVSVGVSALEANTTGIGNTALGYRALQQNTTGFYNLALGARSLISGNGYENVAVGGSSVNEASTLDSLTTGGANTALGILAGQNITSGSNNIAIGWNALVTSPTASNQLSIGNLIFGILPATTTNSFGADAPILPTTGRIGIATSSPFAKLSVHANNGSTDTTLFAIGSSTASATTTLFSVSNIGSTTLASTFGTCSGANALNTTAAGTLICGAVSTAGDGVGTWFTPGTNFGVTTNSTSTPILFTAGLQASTTVRFGNSGGEQFIWNSTLGTLGLGTTTPFATLQVATTTGRNLVLSDTDAGTNLKHWMFSSVGGTLRIATTSDLYATSTRPAFSITDTGKVALGTTTPQGMLSMDQNGGFGSAAITVGGIDQYFNFDVSGSGSTQFGNRTYIVNSPITAANTLVGSIIRIEDSTTTANTVRGLEVQAQRGTNTAGENTALSGFGRTFGVRGTTEGDAGGVLLPAGVFAQTRGTTQGNALRAYSSSITSEDLVSVFQETSSFSGTALSINVGVSSAFTGNFLDLQDDGTSKLTVSAHGTTTIGDGSNQAGLQIFRGGLCVDNDGSCNASTTGRITAVQSHLANSDLAELYFSNEELEAGEIVYTTGGITVGRADEENKQKIIGVVSTNPGLLIGSDDTATAQHEYPVALTGRVPVKVSTEGGEIEVGDRIVLSSIDGVGMKGTDTPIVGIALESFDGEGSYHSEGVMAALEDSVVEPSVQATTTPAERDNCYFGGGVELGEEECVDAEDPDEEETILQPEEPQPIENGPAEELETPEGDEVKVGTVLVFVKLEFGIFAGLDLESLSLEAQEGGETGIVAALIESTLEYLASFAGVVFEQGLAIFDSLLASSITAENSLTVGTPQKPAGITLFDEVSGEPYCVAISGGELVSTPGACGSVAEEESTEGESTVEEPPVPVPSEPVVSGVEPVEGEEPPVIEEEPAPEGDTEVEEESAPEPASAEEPPVPVPSEPVVSGVEPVEGEEPAPEPEPAPQSAPETI